MMQMTEEHKSLWRIKNEYLKDSEGNDSSLDFWKRLAEDKENHIKELTSLIKTELNKM